MSIKFYFEGIPEYRSDKILNYYSHLLGHEAEGSLLSFLIAENLAMGLSTSSYVLDSQFSSINLSVNLT